MDEKRLAGESRWREAEGRQSHSARANDQMNTPDVPKSGRQGKWIYYMRGNKQVRRPYVKPKDPRTTTQLRYRAALTAAAKAWSDGPFLTEEDRKAWCAAAKKVRSRPRLAQSGPLTGQLYFVAVNAERLLKGLEMLRRPPA
jgi:hypothetical protein